MFIHSNHKRNFVIARINPYLLSDTVGIKRASI